MITTTNSVHSDREELTRFLDLRRSHFASELVRTVQVPLLGDICSLPVRAISAVWVCIPALVDRPLHASARELARLYSRGDAALEQRLRAHLYARRWNDAIASAMRDGDLAVGADDPRPSITCSDAAYAYLSEQWSLERAAARIAQSSRRYLETIDETCARIDQENSKHQ